ncbi:MAG TPA: hypothetical protein VHB48_10275 [Chitinophagaceae bacterium]|nr:hypothetical protein [Chitinophagaceae bacterium]
MKQIFLLFVLALPLACNTSLNKSKWPFPTARKCADYYKDLSKLPFQMAEIDSLKINMELYHDQIDSLKKDRELCIAQGRMYLDSSYYYYKIIDGK